MDKKLFIAYKKDIGEIPFVSPVKKDIGQISRISQIKKDNMQNCSKEFLLEMIDTLMENNKHLRKYIELLEKRYF